MVWTTCSLTRRYQRAIDASQPASGSPRGGGAWWVAKAVGLSRAVFAARFSYRVGEPAMRYLLSLRMQRAVAGSVSRSVT